MKKFLILAAIASGLYAQDTRVEVEYPKELKQETLHHMREHLTIVQQITEALSKYDFEKAAKLAEENLGMSSMKKHGAKKAAKYMPKGMKMAGFMLHKSASDFASIASVSDKEDMGDVLKAFSKVTASCIACHAGYKFK